MKKKTWWLVGMVVIILSLGIGGKFYMDKREEEKQQDLIAVEKQSVKVLKQTFADIAEVKFERTGYHNMTGSYSMVVIMTNRKGESVSFDYGFIRDSDELSDYGIVDRDIQEKGKTEGQVNVVYSNGMEEII